MTPSPPPPFVEERLSTLQMSSVSEIKKNVGADGLLGHDVLNTHDMKYHVIFVYGSTLQKKLAVTT